MNEIYNRIRLVFGLFALLLVMFFSVTSASANAKPEDIDEDFEEGGIQQHDMFEFEAFIKHGDVKFGTAPFDKDDEPGNDSADDNGIVRSWDTVTYPLKITVNPKKADSLKNIKLRISGELVNGVTGDRINAKFAVGGKEDIVKKEVSFVQEYTIERTGNSIMIPITVEVQGAKHGVQLRPDFKVEVASIDGQKISDVVTHFDELPSATVSSKVSIKPMISSGLTGNGIPYYPYAAITRDANDLENTHAFSISWGIINLPGKSNIRGATFPDPEGKINYKIDLSGSVAWDNPARTEALNFEGRDTPFMLLDHRPISTTRTSVGAKNTLFEGRSYSYAHSNHFGAPLSRLANANQSHHSVLDSGEWEVEAPTQARHVVSYLGHNTGYQIGSTFPRNRADGYVGSFLYGVNERVFSSNSYLVLMPNEYRIGGPNNLDGKANNVNYRASVTMLSYTDENGVEIPFETQRSGATTFTERNNPSGTMSVQNTFLAYPSGRQIGTPNIGWSTVSKGDASTLIGEDVRFISQLGATIPLYGGFKGVFRWNTDAFELTEAYARTAESTIFSTGYFNMMLDVVSNNRETQEVFYGVAKFDDNSFANFTQKGIHDYDWYETYAEAKKHGPIGAIQNHVKGSVGPKWRTTASFPLRVKHENIGIGSHTKNGTANIAVTNVYAYPDIERNQEIDLSRNRAYHNPAEWDETGTMTKKQSPSGSTINFETLAITPAQAASTLTPNKSTFYNSETIKWTAKNSIVLPESGVPDDLDAGVKVTHTLPQGLDYKTGSGVIGSRVVEPEIFVHSNGTKDLVWDLHVSNSTHSIDTIVFETTINPYALTNSVQSSLEVKSVIESELDQRPVHLRTSTQQVTIIKVGMVGIYETINKLFGPKNSDFKVTLNPYTTIEDERDVAGLTHIPSSDDSIGSNFTGKVLLKEISSEVNRNHNDTVDIYLNNKYIETDKPNLIDVSKDGWYKYENPNTDIKDAKSIYFIVNGLMTNKDDVRIGLIMQTEDNEFGDIYMNETIINSAVDYRLSPLSNRVRYTIRPEWELSMERIQIFTDKYDNGLPVRVRIGEQQPYGKDADISDLTFNLVLYDKESGEKVATQQVKQPDFRNEITMKIPSDKLIKKNDKRRYEAILESYDTNRVWAREPIINTDGHTASEKIIKTSDIKDGQVIQAGVAVTERTLGQDIVVFRDKITLNDVDIYTKPFVTKSGYSFQFAGQLQYQNDMLEAVKNLVGINTSTDVEYLVDRALVDTNLLEGDYADEDAFKTKDDKILIVPSAIEGNSANTSNTSYNLEDLLIERRTGKLFTRSQIDKIKDNNKESNYFGFIDTSIIADETHRESNVLYVPVWIDELGKYDINLKSKQPIGSNYVTFDLDGEVEVEGYMFSHIDSDSPTKDEILINQNK